MNTNLQASLPILRFKDDHGKDFPEWAREKFGNLYSFKSTNSFSRENMNYSVGTVRNIHYGDIHTKFKAQFELSRENVPFLNSDVCINNISDDMFCKEGDLVIADASEDYVGIGKTIELLNLENEKVLAGLHTLLARLNSDLIYVGFSAFMMDCWLVRQQIMKIAQGTKVLGISTGRLSEVKVPLPSKEEQQIIASFLSSINTRIEQLEKKMLLFEQYKKGMMQKIFRQEIRFKDDQGKGYPEWEVKRFTEVFTTQPTSKYQIKSSEVSVDGLYQVVDQSKTLVAGYSDAKEKLFSVTEGVIIYGDHTTAVKYVDFDFIIGADGTKILLPTMDQIIKYLYYCLDYFNVSTEGYKRHFSIVNQIVLPVPSIKEQKKIADFLSSVDKNIELISKQLIQTREFKKGLLQQMFVKRFCSKEKLR